MNEQQEPLTEDQTIILLSLSAGLSATQICTDSRASLFTACAHKRGGGYHNYVQFLSTCTSLAVGDTIKVIAARVAQHSLILYLTQILVKNIRNCVKYCIRKNFH